MKAARFVGAGRVPKRNCVRAALTGRNGDLLVGPTPAADTKNSLNTRPGSQGSRTAERTGNGDYSPAIFMNNRQALRAWPGGQAKRTVGRRPRHIHHRIVVNHEPAGLLHDHPSALTE